MIVNFFSRHWNVSWENIKIFQKGISLNSLGWDMNVLFISGRKEVSCNYLVVPLSKKKSWQIWFWVWSLALPWFILFISCLFPSFEQQDLQGAACDVLLSFSKPLQSDTIHLSLPPLQLWDSPEGLSSWCLLLMKTVHRFVSSLVADQIKGTWFSLASNKTENCSAVVSPSHLLIPLPTHLRQLGKSWAQLRD